MITAINGTYHPFKRVRLPAIALRFRFGTPDSTALCASQTIGLRGNQPETTAKLPSNIFNHGFCHKLYSNIALNVQ